MDEIELINEKKVGNGKVSEPAGEGDAKGNDVEKSKMVENTCDGHHDELEVTFGSIKPTPPKDRYYIVYFIFLLHGIGILLPWNVFINAFDYYQNYKLNTTLSRNASYNTYFLNYIGVASQLPNLLLASVNVFFQSTGDASTQGKRFIGAVLINISALIFTIVLALVDTSEWPYEFFVLTIITVIVLNSATGIYQSFAFGLAAMLPMKYSNAIVIGNNVCGTLVSICSIVTKAAAGADANKDSDSLRTGAVYYFAFAVVVLVLCFDTYFVLPRLNFYRFYTRKEDKKENKLLDNDVADGGEDGGDDVDEKEDDKVEAEEESSLNVLRSCFGLCCFCPLAKGRKVCSDYWEKYRLALPYCWIHCLSVFSVFFCTLSAFPALTASVKPTSDFIIPRDWFTDVACFLFFNLFALLGNLASSFVQVPGPKWLFIPVWVRCVFFIPFFMLCNGDYQVGRVLPVLIDNDWVYVIGMVIFAFTSGYLSSLCMMYASVKAPENLKSIAGMLAAFCLILGVVSGVQFSMLWTKIITGFAE